MAHSFPYTVAPGPLGEFLEKLKTIGVPDKIDQTYLKQVGFSSSNHRPFIPIMKQVDLLDSSGAPTERYRKGLRGGAPGQKLVAEGIRAGYKTLFSTYPDAQARSAAELTTFISTHSNLGDKALRSAVSTFQTLCKFADFSGASQGGQEDVTREEGAAGGDGGGAKRWRKDEPGSGSVTINVNIALSVDATSDPAVYDAFFAAMAKHIKVLDGSSSHPS
ncbi:DUF5343 domain-containing protein [Pimelobacter simplex]|uniref:DUF5343 domain-containing protein n=1 Tax=Nocardioides simplex TaxID=2045 RepID=UPI00366EBA3E